MNFFSFQSGILFSVGAFAGFIDTIAGGGGMITVPALLSTGISPVLALGTDKLQSAIAEISASLRLAFSRSYHNTLLVQLAIFTITGSTLGVFLVQSLPSESIKKALPLILLVVFIYLVFFEKGSQNSKEMLQKDIVSLQPQTLSSLQSACLGLPLGFYNGFIGPATGTFWVLALTSFPKWSFKTATIYAKPMNFVGNFIAILGFALGGNIDYKIAGIMGIGSLIGGIIGANFLISSSAKLIKYIYIFAVAFSLVFMTYNIYRR